MLEPKKRVGLCIVFKRKGYVPVLHLPGQQGQNGRVKESYRNFREIMMMIHRIFVPDKCGGGGLLHKWRSL